MSSTRRCIPNWSKRQHIYISKQPFENIPGPKGLPLIGNLWRYFPLIGDYKPDTLFQNAQFNKKRYGSIVREQLTDNHAILHLFDPQDVGELFRQDGKYPNRRSHRALLKYRLDRPKLYLGGGLFPENGPNWHRQRAQFQSRLMSKPQVSSNTIKFDEMSLRSMRCIDALFKDSNNIEISKFNSLLSRWALGTTLYTFLDTDIDKMAEESQKKLMEVIDNTLMAIDKTEIQTEKWIKHPDKCPAYKMLIESQDYLYDFVSKQIDGSFKMQYNDSDISYMRDWLRIDKLDRRDVICMTIDLIMAGLHTTSYTLAFLLYHIARTNCVQSVLRKEIELNLPQEGPLEIDHIQKLTFLEDCLRESMRLNPISIGTGRLVLNDGFTIRNYEIPIGTMVIAQTQAISRDEKIYSDADKFKPERWTLYKSCPAQYKPSPFATRPFGFGARACIGQHLARLQIKVFTARFLQRYKIVEHDYIDVKTTLIHTIKGNYEVTLNKI